MVWDALTFTIFCRRRKRLVGSTGAPQISFPEESAYRFAERKRWLIGLKFDSPIQDPLVVLVASGFSIAGLVNPASFLPAGFVPNDASMVFAMYAAARTIPLALFVIIATLRRSTRTLIDLGILAGTVQLVDGFIGVLQHDAGKTFGPLAIAVLQAYGIVILHRTTYVKELLREPVKA